MNDRAETLTNSAEDEALQWLVDFDDLSAEEQSQFTAWLGERPENGAAFEKQEREWRGLDVLRQLATETTDPNVVNHWLRIRRLQRRFLPMAAAAAMLAIAATLWVSSPSIYKAQYQTTVGKQRQIVLPDESVVTLNTNSRVTIRYSDDERRVRLEKGEAHFTITPAPDRPFSVLAGTGVVRAVGTAFNVYLKDDVVEVTVTEGTVEVLPDAEQTTKRESPKAPPERAVPRVETPAESVAETLTKGHKLEYRDAIESVSNVAPEEIARKLAWQDGMLDFQGETLLEVIEEASRYTSTRITIEDPELEGLHVSGYFKAGDIDTLMALIESNDRVTVRRVSPRSVQILSAQVL